MKIVPPVTVNDARLTSTTIAEPDTARSEVAWVSGSNYAIGAQVIRTQTHRRYQALVAITAGTTAPESAPTQWTDIGPTNRYAMFDTERNSSAVVTGTSISIVITPSLRVSALCIFGMVGIETVTVTGRSGIGGSVVYSKTVNLSSRTTADWSDYFFGTFSNRESLVLLDLPLQTNLSVTVDFARAASGTMSIETVAIGNPLDIGGAQYGASSDIIDFSRVDRDAFGNATLVKRKNVPVFSATILADKAKVPAIRKLREQYAATPLVFLALDDSSDSYFDALALIGIYKRMTVVVDYPNSSLVQLEAEGL